MKLSILSLVTSLVLSLSGRAGIISEPTNGIYLAVVQWDFLHGPGPVTNEPFRFDSELYWAGYCNTGRVNIWSPVDPAYGVKIRMLGPSGKEVKKTWEGNQYGAKWDKLHSYKDTKLGSICAWGSFEENQGGANGRRLLPPQRLFSMDQPGIYTMEIQIQLFRYAATKDPEEWSRNLLRFSPIRIKVEKPPPPSAKKE